MMTITGQSTHADGEDNPSATEEDVVRTTERERLRALVEVNMDVAHQLHTEDFQLITPGGSSLTKEQYLGKVASGSINYLLWEPEEIDVRLHGRMAVIRYQAQIEIIIGGKKLPLGHYWHTDFYEKHTGRWQAVWSQATQIK